MPDSLDLADALDVAYSYLVDGINGLVDAQEVREKIDKALLDSWIDRETWGVDADELDAVPSAAPLVRQDGER